MCHPGLGQFSCCCMRSQQGAAYSRLREYLFCIVMHGTKKHGHMQVHNLDKNPTWSIELQHSRPGITKRQRRRLYEDVYWTNVHVNAIKSGVRRLKRMDKATDAIFDEFAELVAQERLHCSLAEKKVLFSLCISVTMSCMAPFAGPCEQAQPAHGKLSDFKLPMP